MNVLSILKSDQCDFEGAVGDKIRDRNAFGGIVDPNLFKPCASDSD